MFFQFFSLFILSLSICIGVYSQFQNNNPIFYQEKQEILNYLGYTEIIEKFGKISDILWSYAELRLQEYKSSELLSNTLEKAGFKVERELAGMPTCFMTIYGSEKPVIGLLDEYDALPMLSQKGRVPYHDSVIKGTPGHGCGYNTMGTAVVAAAIAVKHIMERYNNKS